MGWHTDKDKDTLYAETGSLVRAGCAGIGFFKNPGSVEIPDLTSIPEIRDEPVFDGYRKGGCLLSPRDGGLVKIVVRPFSECNEGTRENNHQTIF